MDVLSQPLSALPGLIAAIEAAGFMVSQSPEGWLVNNAQAVQVIIDNYNGSVAELSFNRSIKQQSLADQYTALFTAGRIYNNKIWQIDPASQSSITSAATWAQLNVPGWSIGWIADDNSVTTMDAPTFLAFAQNVAAYVSAMVLNNRALKTAIAAASDVASLAAIDVTAGWPSNP